VEDLLINIQFNVNFTFKYKKSKSAVFPRFLSKSKQEFVRFGKPKGAYSKIQCTELFIRPPISNMYYKDVKKRVCNKESMFD
jgi:hypothetical protein